MSEIIIAFIPCDWRGKNIQEVEARQKLEYDQEDDDKR